MGLKFSVFRKACNKAKNVVPFEGKVLALDPGETTGWAMFESTAEDAKLLCQGQIKTWPMIIAVDNLTKMIEEHKPDFIVHEMYAVYEWKSQDHSWSQIPTVRVIGCIETLSIQQHISYSSQTAQVAKNFCTDEKLKTWDFYEKGMRHARDAVRHGTYFLLFSNEHVNK